MKMLVKELVHCTVDVAYSEHIIYRQANTYVLANLYIYFILM